MKAIKLTCLLMLACALAVQSQPPQSTHPLEEKVNDLIVLLQQEQIDQNMHLFTQPMQDFFKEQGSQALWKTLENQLGTFTGIKRYVHDASGSYHVITAVADFELMPAGIKVVFEQDLIAGLGIVPVPPEKFTDAPSYSDPDKFTEQELMIDCGDIELPAILSMPQSTEPVAAVVLVHGSGPNDMDETIGPNKPFRDIAHGLATKGIAVLRYDKRTLNHGQSLDPSAITPWEETGRDAVKAAGTLAELSGIDPSRIFILGHSLGGTMAPMIAQHVPELEGIIILAGASRKIYDLLLEQVTYLAPKQDSEGGGSQEMITTLTRQVENIHNGTLTPDSPREESPMGQSPSYWLFFRDYNQVEVAAGLPQRILVLHGGRDYQVPQKDFDLWKEGLEMHHDTDFIAYPGLNHLFIHGTGTPNPDEYYNEGNVSEDLINDIASWILNRQ